MRRIVVGVDGSPAAEAAVRWAAGIAAATGTTLHLLHIETTEDVSPWPAVRRGGPEREVPPPSAPAITAVLGVADELAGGAAVTHAVRHGPVGQTLVDASGTAEVIVLGRKARRTPGWLRPGSTSHRVVDEAECPVVLVPGPGRRPSP